MELIARLADGAWHSGPALAAALGISRAAVWKQVQALAALGLEADAVRGRGYRLRAPFEPLDAGAINSALSPTARAALARLEVAGSVDSTNSRLLHGLAERNGNRALFAEHQSGGRGRRGRGWASPWGANLYLSVAWRFDPAPAVVAALGLAAGVAVAEALRGLGADGLKLKWPNDLVADGAKLGGILVEHRGEAAGGAWVVVGVGINLSMQPGQAGDLDQSWITLASLVAHPPSRNTVATAVLDALVQALTAFAVSGFAGFRVRWSRLDALQGQPVWLETGGGRVAATAAGIAPDGALLATVNGQTQRYYAGDVSLRKREARGARREARGARREA